MSDEARRRDNPSEPESRTRTKKGLWRRLGDLKETSEPILWLLGMTIGVGLGVYFALVPYAREAAKEAVLTEESLSRIAQLVRPHAIVTFTNGTWRIINDSGADAYIEDLVLSDGVTAWDINLVIKLNHRTSTPPLLRCLTQNVAVHSIYPTNRNDWGYRLVADMESRFSEGPDGVRHFQNGVWEVLTTKSQFDVLVEIFP